MALSGRFANSNGNVRPRASSPAPRRVGMEGELVAEIYSIWKKAGYDDVDALRRLFLLKANSESTMPVLLDLLLSLGGLATSLFQAWQNSAPTELLSAPKPLPLLDTVNTMEFFALMGEREYQLWLWYALGGYFALALVLDVFIANVVTLARAHFGSDSLVFIETVKAAIGSTGRVTNVLEKAQTAINALHLVEILTDIKLLLKQRAAATGQPPKDLLVTLDRFALYLTIEKARDDCDFKPEEFGLSMAEAASIMRIFVKYDADEDFRISRTEFMRLCKAESNRVMPREEIQLLAAMLDDNNDGYIDFTPFAQWWAEKRQTGSVLRKPDTSRVSRVLPRSLRKDPFYRVPPPRSEESSPPPRKAAPPPSRTPRHSSSTTARVSNGASPVQRSEPQESFAAGFFKSRAPSGNGNGDGGGGSSGNSLIENARMMLERIGVSPPAKRSSSPHANKAERLAKEAAMRRQTMRANSPGVRQSSPGVRQSSPGVRGTSNASSSWSSGGSRPYETRIAAERNDPLPAWRRRSSSPRDRIYGKRPASNEYSSQASQPSYEEPVQAQEPMQSRELRSYDTRVSSERDELPAWRRRSSSPRDRVYGRSGSDYGGADYGQPAAEPVYSPPSAAQSQPQSRAYETRVSDERQGDLPAWRRRSSSPRDRVYGNASNQGYSYSEPAAAEPVSNNTRARSPEPVPSWRRRSSSPRDRTYGSSDGYSNGAPDAAEAMDGGFGSPSSSKVPEWRRRSRPASERVPAWRRKSPGSRDPEVIVPAVYLSQSPAEVREAAASAYEAWNSASNGSRNDTWDNNALANNSGTAWNSSSNDTAAWNSSSNDTAAWNSPSNDTAAWNGSSNDTTAAWNGSSPNGVSSQAQRKSPPSYATRISNSGSSGSSGRSRSPKARVYPKYSGNGTSSYDNGSNGSSYSAYGNGSSSSYSAPAAADNSWNSPQPASDSWNAPQPAADSWNSSSNGHGASWGSNGSSSYGATPVAANKNQGSRFAARRGQESAAREAYKRSTSPKSKAERARARSAEAGLSPSTYSTFDLAQRRFESVQQSAQPTWDRASESTLVPPVLKKKVYSYESRRSSSPRSAPPRRGMTFSARQNNQSWDTYSSSSAPSASSSSSSLPMALQGCTLNEYVHQVTRRTDLVSTVSAIKTACKGIAAKAALGSTQQDSKSVYESAHELLVDELARTSCVQRISSAFENQPRDCSGRGLVVVMQPLVPTSSLFPDNSPTGTLFAVYDANCPSDKDPVMQKGKKALAAGYCLYGSSTTLFLSVGDGVHGWTLDPVQGTYVCTHPNVRLPEHGRLLALDTAEVMEWPESLCKYAKTVCEGRGKSGTAYAMRFTGSVVADFHNVLLIGGLAGCPYAEINLMHECIPLSYLAEQAGGKATDGFGYRILNIEPIHREECMPAFMGCFGDVAELESYGTVRVEELHPPVSAFASRY